MKIITNREQLNKNLKKLEQYLHSESIEEQEEARSFIKLGTCFVAYNDGQYTRFAPSRFVGYEDKTFEKHTNNFGRDGGKTNPAISKLLNVRKPLVDEVLEDKYQQYCHSLGFIPRPKGSFGVRRKYWKL